ncbi:hypothetical protein [Lactobacillus kullabergensis]
MTEEEFSAKKKQVLGL